MNTDIMTWPKDAFDAVSIRASECELYVQGVDGDKITLEGELDGRNDNLPFELTGRLLKIYGLHDHLRHGKIGLKLPEGKAWMLDFFSGKGSIKVNGIESHLRIMLGKGNVEIEKLTGVLVTGSGQANISVKNFVQKTVPEMPVQDRDWSRYSHDEYKRTGQNWWTWLGLDENEWREWGESLGERIGRWAIDLGWWFTKFEGGKISDKDAGINLRTANGNIELRNITAKAGLLKLVKGNLKIEKASWENLEINLTRGNIEGRAVVPSGNWTVKNVRGNVQLSIPSNIPVRLDMATRSGNINSEMPMVRVTRRGPETYSGRRMVGVTGPSVEGRIPEVYISTVNGNIEVKSDPPVDMPENNAPGFISDSNSEIRADTAQKTAASHTETKSRSADSDARLVVLKALEEGRISVAEAEQLLRSLRE